jgi:hypothetical protein
MGEQEKLKIFPPETSGTRRWTRRELVQQLLVGGGAFAVWPTISGAHPIRAHLENSWILDEADEKLGGAEWKPIFLNAGQNEELIALSEAIVPGAKKAEANRFIDLLLSVDSATNQKTFVDSLAAMGNESQKEFGKIFSKLDATQQFAVLRTASEPVAGATASADWDDDDDDPKSKSAALAHLFDHFQNLKSWIAGAYYSSEIGMRELGWTENRVFATFPGCEHELGSH